MLLDRAITFLVSAFAFFLPWQTALILRQGLIGKAGTQLEGPWQYGTIQLYGLDFVFAALLVCVGLRVVRYGFPAPIDRVSRFATVSLGMLVASAAALVPFASDRVLAFVLFERLAEGTIVFFIIRHWVKTETPVAITWVLAGCIQALMGVVQFLQQEIVANSWLGLANHAPQNLGDSVVENADIRWLRAYGSFPHPNLEGAFLAIALLLCFALLQRTEKKWQSYLLVLAAPLLSAGLFFTFCREAWLGLMLGAVAAVIAQAQGASRESRPLGEHRVSGGVVAFVLCMLTLSILSAAHWEPLSARFGIGGWQRLEKRSFQERMSGVGESIPFIRTHLFGVGVGQYTRAQFENDLREKRYLPWFSYQPVHNTILLAAAEIGFIGAGALLAFLGWILVSTRRSPVGLAVGIVLIAIASFDHFFWSLAPGIVMFWLAAGLATKLAPKTS